MKQDNTCLSTTSEESFDDLITSSSKELVDWMSNNQTKNGDFVYQYFYPSAKIPSDNNIVRQAASVYSLSQYYSLTKDEEAKTTLLYGLEYFKALSYKLDDGAIAIKYDDQIKSNTTAFIILALVNYYEIHPASDLELDYLTKLGDYIVSTQKISGGFIYRPLISNQESNYNNGESFYALLRLYDLTNDEKYLESAKRAGNLFLQKYTPNRRVDKSFFAWGLTGFYHLYKHTQDERYREYMKLYTDRFINESTLPVDDIDNVQGYWSVFLEGITHTAAIFKEDQPQYYSVLKKMIRDNLNVVLSLQINSPISSFKSDDPRLKGAICNDIQCSYIRVDTNQHTISAIVLYQQLLD